MTEPTTNKLLEVLGRVDEDGNSVYGPDELRHALPYLAFALELPLDTLGDDMQELIAEAMAAAGASTSTGDDEAAALDALRQYYVDHPVAPALLDDVRRALGLSEVPTVDKRALDLVGGAASARPVGADPPPEGSVKGAMARFAPTTPTSTTKKKQ